MSPHPQNQQSKHEHELSEFELAEFKQAFEEFDKVSLKTVFFINNIGISLLTFYHFVLSINIIKNLIPNKTAGLQGKCYTQIIETASFIGCQWLYFSR